MTLAWFAILLLTAAMTARRGMAAMVAACFVLSIFQAAAAIAVGGLFVPPAQTFLAIVTAGVMVRALNRDDALWLFHAARLNIVVVLFVAWCVFTAIVFPQVFSGRVVVFPLQSSMFPGQELARYYLRPEPTNFNQSFYAILGLVAAIVATYAAAREGTLGAMRRGVIVSVALVCAIGAIQWAVRFAGLPFEPPLLYNNTGVALLLDQSFGAVPRINATYIEPSSLAVGMAPLVAYLITVALIDHRARKLGLLGVAGGLLLILSTSTTAYFGLAIAIAAVVVTLAIHQRAMFFPSALVLTLVGLLICALLGLVLWALVPAIHDAVLTVFNATVTDKGSSSSAIERGNWNRQALANCFETFGLGTGFGSSRASGLIYVLLGTTGVPGLLLFVAMVGQALLPGKHDHSASSPDLAGLKAGLLTAALTLMVSGAELTSLPFWLMIGTLAVNRLPAAREEMGAHPSPTSGTRAAADRPLAEA